MVEKLKEKYGKDTSENIDELEMHMNEQDSEEEYLSRREEFELDIRDLIKDKEIERYIGNIIDLRLLEYSQDYNEIYKALKETNNDSFYAGILLKEGKQFNYLARRFPQRA